MLDEYKRLKEAGYSEEEIRVRLEQLSQIDVDSSSLGANRDDRSVSVKDSSGTERKTSHIMMGYNRQGIQLENGIYISYEEFERALQEELKSHGEDAIFICKSKGKVVSTDTIVKTVLKEILRKKSHLSISQDNAVLNQQSAHVTISDKATKKDYSKGVFMMGNDGIQLPNGEYVLSSEIEEALAKYVALKPNKKKPKPPIPPVQPVTQTPTPTPDPEPSHDPTQDEVYTVVKRIVKKISLIPIIIATILNLLKGFGYDDEFIDKTTLVKELTANASLSQSQELTEEEALAKTTWGMERLSTGERLEMPEGVDFYRSSDTRHSGDKTHGTFGQESRPAGDYNVDYFSIVHKGKVVKVASTKGITLGKFVQDTSLELGIDAGELEVWMHMGDKVSGWVSIDDVIKAKTQEATRIRTKLDNAQIYNVTQENFNSKTVTFKNGENEVTVSVVDVQGNLLPAGSIVKGSDGQDYEIESLDVVEEDIHRVEKVPAGKKLTWSFKNITPEFFLTTAALAAIATILTKRDRKETTQMTNEQIYDYIKRTKATFNSESEFHRAVETIIAKTPVVSHDTALRDALVAQEITLEDVDSLGGRSI